jgi:iron complex outermembrane receptor protein
VAVRTEKYSDFGNSTTPKFGIKYSPTDLVAVRGTYAKGFRAPSLSQISESSVQAFNNGVQDPLRCPVFDSTNRDCSVSFASYIRANPGLHAEKSDNYTAGIILSPTRDFSVSVDYWDIKRKEQIDRFSATYLLNRESQFPGSVIRDPNQATWLPGVPNSGPIFAVLRQFFNLASTEVSGVDVDARYTMRFANAGRLATTFSGTYLSHYKYAVAKTDPLVDQAGTFGGPNDALPRVKAILTSTYTTGPWDFTGRVNYVSSYSLTDGTGACLVSATLLNQGVCRVSSWTTVDAGVQYTGIRNLTLGLLVRNVADKDAPYDAAYAQTTQRGYDPAFHNPYGRYYVVNASYRFR